MKALILPGLNGSGPLHWQTMWEIKRPDIFRRVQEPNWDHPDRDVWVNNLERAVSSSGSGTILVAHSLACLQVVHWAAQTQLRIKGALLVAPPNPERPEAPSETASFKNVPRIRLPFSSILVVSGNDPYADLPYFEDCAQTWGSCLMSIGAAGHINASSSLGDWPQGFALFESLIKG